VVETQPETLDTISGSLLPPSGTPRKLARPPLGSGRRPRTVGAPDLPPRGPEGEGYAASHRATISAGSGHAPTPKVARTAAHPSTTTGSLALRGTGGVPARPSWWRLPAGVVDELGHAVRSATHHAGGDPGSRLRHAGQPADGGVIDHCAGLNSDGRRRSWVGCPVLPCRARVDEGGLMAGKRSLGG
jgi:hypothetical protein